MKGIREIRRKHFENLVKSKGFEGAINFLKMHVNAAKAMRSEPLDSQRKKEVELLIKIYEETIENATNQPH